ncbi:MAG: TetR/AcrR family transcriptional regulator [Eubacteriales bacterium]
MYRGTNPTALKSQQWIKESLYELLKEISYDKINVKNITERAGLARQTFYKLYNNKDEIVEHILDDMFYDFKDSLLKHEKINLRTLSFCYFEYFLQNKEIVYLLINNNLMNLMELKFCEYLNKVRMFVSDKENAHNQYIVSMV